MKNLNIFSLLYKSILLFMLLSILWSCEKVIEIDIKDAKIQTVVEAYVKSTSGDNLVILSKSANFYGPNDFPMIKGANVTISTNTDSYKLVELKDGYYHHPTLGEYANKNYKLTIVIDGEQIISESTMPNLVQIDSLTFVENPNQGQGPGGGNGGPRSGTDEQDPVGYKVYCNFQDPLNEDNYYKINILESNSQNFNSFIINDDLFNGLSAKIKVHSSAIPGDTITVQLSSIDKANYEYYRLLDANGMGAFTTSVGNPISNVQGDNTIGIFGAYATSTKVLILPGNNP